MRRHQGLESAKADRHSSSQVATKLYHFSPSPLSERALWYIIVGIIQKVVNKQEIVPRMFGWSTTSDEPGGRILEFELSVEVLPFAV